MIQTLSRERFPESIQPLEGFPENLNFKGNLDLFQKKMLAIVGTRNPTPYGIRAAHYFSRAITQAGFAVVSGLAVGIDTIAHRTCLSEKGQTLAVLAHGLDILYPRQNAELAEEILKHQGLLVSEFAEGVQPLKYHFPRRNRIISGLAEATLVIEASEKSGSLITARWALEQGKTVFVVPGPFDSPSFAGSHSLIREGAVLVKNIDDILIEMPTYTPKQLDLITETVSEEFEAWKERFKKLGGHGSLSELMDISGLASYEVMEAMKKAQSINVVAPNGFQSWVWLRS